MLSCIGGQGGEDSINSFSNVHTHTRTANPTPTYDAMFQYYLVEDSLMVRKFC